MNAMLAKFMQDKGYTSVEDVANLFEITATEFSDAQNDELARDYILMASVLRGLHGFEQILSELDQAKKDLARVSAERDAQLQEKH